MINLKTLVSTTAVLAALASPAWAWDASTSGPVSPIAQDGGLAQAQGQGQAQKQRQAQGQSQALSNRVVVRNSVTNSGGYSGGGGYVDARQAPDVLIPSIGGGGADCPVVGFGVGGSGIGGGGGFGPSWISSRCDHRHYAELIAQLTHNPDAGLAYLASVEPDVKQWMESAHKAEPQHVTYAEPVTDLCGARPGWTAEEARANYLKVYHHPCQ